MTRQKNLPDRHENRRREFIRWLGISWTLSGTGLVLARPSQSAPPEAPPAPGRDGRDPVLVVFFQRGAADALHMLIPYRDQHYRSERGPLALSLDGSTTRRGRGEDNSQRLTELGDGFALHPGLEPLHRLYADNRFAPIVNVGSPDPTRSHFDAQDYMESGTPGIKGTRDGWMARLVRALDENDPETRLSPFAAVALTHQLPRSLAGTQDAIAMPDFSRLSNESGRGRMASSLEERIHRLYRRDDSPVFTDAGSQATAAVRLFQERDPLAIPTRTGIRYPNGQLGAALKQLGQMIRADIGLRVAFVESSGWDTHFAQGGLQGSMARLMNEMASGIAALVDDVGDDVPMTVLTMTEFGRSVRANGAGGTDHGHGGASFVIGSGVRGGHVHGDWLSLKKSNLFEGRDLPVTTDFRDVFSEVARSSLGLSKDVQLFPGHQAKKVGVMS